jgi:hypothetical protein
MKSTSPKPRNTTGGRLSRSSSAAARRTGPASPKLLPPPSASNPSSPNFEQQNQELLARLRSWKSSLPEYCRQVLKIRDKAGTTVPLLLNRSQLHLHQVLEAQRQETGKVRALVLKGRQQGVSTYLQARFFWWTSLNLGRRALILTHRQDASDHLFGMAERFYQHSPLPPRLGASNAKELVFHELESGYQVATAGAKAVGRSMTCQLFHGSEVAFWESAEDHMAGIGQIVPDAPGTEIILESTANGVGNLFHRMWQAAAAGQSDYRTVFIPWFWQPEYRRVVSTLDLDDQEDAYRAAYGLDLEQMAWRHAKIATDFAGDAHRFEQEYPASADLAFVLVGVESFIPAPLVMAARASRSGSGQGPLVVGVDPARFGDDDTAIVRRRGRVVCPVERIRKRDTMHVAGAIARLIKEDRPARVFIDIGGLGSGIYDRLLELGFGYVVSPVNFGESAGRSERYKNRRAEMWGLLKEWLQLPPASIPDDDGLAADLVGPQYTYDSEGRLKLESKEDMRKRGIRSPDAGDALALTFAAPVGYGDQGTMTSPAELAWEHLEAAVEAAAGRSLGWIQTG